MVEDPSNGNRQTERRSETRYPARRLIEVLPCRGRNEWKFLHGVLVDASLKGIGITLDEPIDVEDQFLVKLRTVHGVRLLLYTVQSCTKGKPPRYRIGAAFTRVIDPPVEENPRIILEAFIAGA